MERQVKNRTDRMERVVSMYQNQTEGLQSELSGLKAELADCLQQIQATLADHNSKLGTSKRIIL